MSEVLPADPVVDRAVAPTPTQPDQMVDESQPRSQSSPPRFHDMDSLRAAMMLLGLVFHVAWFFQPIYFGHPLSDAKGGTGYLYFFSWVHQFRMHVFFLIAGFFACLLIKKRGQFAFAKNRFMRVVIPLGLSMVTIYPLMKLQYLRGGLTSGRIISDEPIASQFWAELANLDWQNEWIVHLWFLECLILIYAISLLLRLAFDFVVDRGNSIRPQITKLTNRLSRSHWGPVLLAVPVAACMAYDLTWFGIDSGPIKPLWAGVLAYWIFFGVGWCLYSAPEIVDVYVRRWPGYLILGSVMSFALCGYFHHLLMDGRISFFYPAVLDTEIDFPSLRTNLLRAADAPESQSDYRVIWDALSPSYQEFLRNSQDPTSDQLVGFTMDLSKATVLNPEFPALIGHQAPGATSQESFDPVANRTLLAERLAEIPGRWTPPLWIRAIYFYAYGLATWLMTFGMLGLFRRYMSQPNATIRYLADSSYWLYLIHIPLQFEMAIHMGLWEANGFLKFAIYNIATFAILIPSYHYLVRPTWLGYMLNGRLYPLKSQSPATT